jgi:hypothetical protein
MVDENTMTHIITKRLLDSSYSEYLGIARDNNNNFMPAGYIYKDMGSLGILYKMLVAKYDASQNLQWAYALKTNQATNDYCYSVCYQPFDDTWAICGTLNEYGKIFVLKLSQSGNVIWFKTYTPYISGYTFNNADARKIIAMPDGSFTVAGWLKEQGSSRTDMLLFRLTGQGAVSWSYTYNGLVNSSEKIYSMDRSLNGSVLVLTGSVRDNMPTGEDVLNAQLDGTNGNVTWARRRLNNNYGGSLDAGFDIEFTKNTSLKIGHFITGQIEQYPTSGENTLFMKTKPNGTINTSCMKDVLLTKNIVKLNIDSTAYVTETLGDIQIYPIYTPRTVTTYSQCTNPPHITEDSPGGTEEENASPVKFALEQNYPNPFNPKTVIRFSLPMEGSVSIVIFDINGKQVAGAVNEVLTAGMHSIEFDGSALPSGAYFYRLNAGKFTETKKMLIVK